MTSQPDTDTLDLRGLTITTAIVGAAQERLAGASDGEAIDPLVERAPGISRTYRPGRAPAATGSTP